MRPEDDEDDDSSLSADNPLTPGDEDEDEESEGSEEFDVEDDDDGGATVRMRNDTPVKSDPEFYANLAEVWDEPVLRRISAQLLDFIKHDEEDRKERDDQYAEGIRRTGMGKEAPGGADFQGASRVVHPLLTEACVDFAARAIKELMPSTGIDNGPTKAQIVGKVTQEKVDKARRKARHMNWQLTKQMPEFRPGMEQNLTQLPLAGAGYLKLIWDRRLKRPKPNFIPQDEIILPFAADSFYAAERKTHRQDITELEFQRRVRSGLYRDIDLIPPSDVEQTEAEKATDKIEGKTQGPYNDQGLRTVYETYVTMEIEEDDLVASEGEADFAPYIVTVDKTTGEVLAIYRNWEPDDEVRKELDWIVEWPFVPWRGAYPIGLTHMIGGLSGAATGALRALLDSAFLQTSPAAAKLKGGSIGGQNVRLRPGEIAEIEGTPNSDDIRKVLMNLPYEGPSPVLMELLGFLVETGKGVVQTTFEKMSDQPANQPVGTTLALIEQGLKVFSAIHERLHGAMGRTLAILHRLNQMYLEEEELFDDAGELLAKRSDYEGPCDVEPVSDPNIFSEAQRFAQIELISQRALATAPYNLYDMRKVEELVLERTKIPNAKDLLLPRPEPQRLNAVNENVAASMGRPIVAFPNQDHLAHLQVHIDFMLNPLFGSNPLIGPTFLPAMLTHIKDHITLWYVTAYEQLLSQAAGVSITELMDDDDEVSEELDRTIAAASPLVNRAAMQELQALPPIIQQAMQLAQQMAPQPTMMDPTQAAMAEVNRKSQADQMVDAREKAKIATDQQKASADAQAKMVDAQAKAEEARARAALEADRARKEQQRADADRAVKMREMQQRAAIDAQKIATTERVAAANNAAKAEINTADNATALTIAEMEVESGEKVALENGKGMNPSG
ncbi:MAG TPA: hypothetical protein PLU52_10065 [Opitutaceae bacterium]|nr:hypothetical protein [Opitutaceae bacterium]